MKIQVLQENLVKALNQASRLTSTKVQLPVLGNIALSAKKTKLLISATNLEISIATSIGAKVEKEGSLTVPAKIISELVGNLQSGAINLEVQEEQLKISTTNFKGSVLGMNSSDFPVVPESLEKGSSQAFPKEEFIRALSQTIFAVSIDETRPQLTGVLFLFKKGELLLVATDGFRLSMKKLKVSSESKVESVILPRAALIEASRLTEEEGEIYFSFKEKENQAVFGTENTVLSTRLLSGKFPDFERIIPKDSRYKVSCEKDEFLRGVKVSSVFARESANIIKIGLGEDYFELSAESSQSGQQKTKIDAKVEGIGSGGSKTKDGFQVAFNFRFLEELLPVIAGDEVQFELLDSASPGVFRDPKDPDFLHLIMPVKIGE